MGGRMVTAEHKMRYFVAIPLLLAAIAIVGLMASLPAQAKPKQQPIPWVASPGGITWCIDFDGDGVCPNNLDGDGFSNEDELALGSDPNDANSTPEYGLVDEQTPAVKICGDGLDNDLDGRVDSADSGCHVTCRDFQVGLACTDEDKDGLLQYVEIRLGSDPNNPEVPFVVTIGDCIDFDSSSDCGSGDDDADGWNEDVETRLGSDPNDAGSTPEYGLLDEQTGSSTCNDGTDNDRDGSADHGDEGCRVTCRDYAKAQACTDGDHDGWLQYVEHAYGSEPNDPSSTPETFELPDTCSDGVDNDGDGLMDDADTGCSGLGDCIDFTGDPPCEPLSTGRCALASHDSVCPAHGEQSLHECARSVLSWIAHGGAAGLTRRDELTGEVLAFPEHLNAFWNPARFRGPEGEERLLSLVGIDLETDGCVLPSVDLTICIDFDSADRCGDDDGDGWWNELEWRTGSDPNSVSSTPEHRKFDEQWDLNTCGDKLDNDGDAARDMADASCRR